MFEILLLESEPLDCCGVYFLLKSEKIIYVGSAENVARRVKNHEIPFDRFTFLRTSSEDLRHIEKEYIRQFAPPLNRAHNPKVKSIAGGKRSGAGRPAERGATVITIRTHDKTKAALVARAAARGLSLSEFMIRISIGEKGFDQD